MIESMLHAVWLVDAVSLRVVAANNAAGLLMGVRAAELVGRGVLDLAATPEDLCFWDEAAGGLADSIESETFVCRLSGGTAPVTRRVKPGNHPSTTGIRFAPLARLPAPRRHSSRQ